MRAQLIPEDYDKKPPGSVAVQDIVQPKDGKRRKVKCTEMKYNKFQMYDMNDTGMANSTFRYGGREAGATSSPDKSPVHLHQNTESDIREIRRYLRTMMGRIERKEEINKIALEWRIVALVMDRVFFFIYLFTIVTSLATIFPKTFFR